MSATMPPVPEIVTAVPTPAAAPAATPPAPASGTPLEQAASRVDRAASAVAALPDDARKTADELKSALDALHKLGLQRLVQRLREDPEGKRLLFALVDEPEVYALLAMHGLVRPDIPSRVRRCLEQIRPYLEAEHVQVELLSIDAQGAQLELRPTTPGGSSNLNELEHEIEDAILRSVPEVGGVQVRQAAPPPKLVSIESLLRPAAVAKISWHPGPMFDSLREGKLETLTAEGVELLLVRFGDQVRAYENACPHQGLPLERSMVDTDARTLSCPWHGYRFDCETGECLTAPEGHLRAYPVRILDGRVEVRLP